MPSKSVKKTTPPVETIQNVTSDPVQVETPTVEKVAETQPVKQKGGKKTAKTTQPETVVTVSDEVMHVTETVPPVEVKTTVKSVTKRGGAKSKPVVEASTDVSTNVEVKETKKRAPKSVKPTQEAGTEEQTGGAPKTKVAKKQPVKKATKLVVETDIEESTDRRIRSFKVKLPEKEEFEGRFTGLTPYQAANKALSKYFRETESPKKEITFLICESTRKSKKSVYTYVGKRYQLEVPVKYTIQDGRVIVKNFKNSLKKVKKIDLIDQAGGSSVPVATPATV